MTLGELLKRLGTSPGRAGFPSNVTYAQPGRTNPQTVPLIPGLPGLILAPEDRPMSPEEQSHEGTHAALGLPGAVAGVVGAELAGVGRQGSYLAPDELLAYLSQPDTEDTVTDRQTISSLAGALEAGGIGNRSYLRLIQALTGNRMGDLIASAR